MALLPTTPMLTSVDLSWVRVLHLEPTTVCNAACPQCARENPALFDADTNRSELSLSRTQELFSLEFARKLDKVFMCGNFGEPAAAKDTLEIFRFFREHNKQVTLGMNTNGSVRDHQWWQELAGIFSNSLDYVVFSLDGLDDTNHIYRRNTSWSRIMNNVQSFISAGGTAHWDMLIFEHNQHQVHQARDLARDLGFSWFRAKVSKRFATVSLSDIRPPVGFSLPNVKHSKRIRCHALNESSIYVSANGKVLPCCWFGEQVFALDPYAKELLDDWHALEQSWNTRPHPVCVRTCSQDELGTSFSKQWQIEEQLK